MNPFQCSLKFLNNGDYLNDSWTKMTMTTEKIKITYYVIYSIESTGSKNKKNLENQSKTRVKY